MSTGKRILTRDSDAARLLELLFVVAVATILINRAFLALTGYPRIAFGHFHIAHMLWGGLLMLVSLVMVFHYWNPSVRRLAAFTSGIGFGLFIDELGKFITKDNDYFFKPTIAIIYVIFVVMYLSFRKMTSGAGPLSADELEVNSTIRNAIDRAGTDTDSKWLRGYFRVRSGTGRVLYRFFASRRIVTGIMLFFVLKSILQFAVVLGVADPGWIPFESVSGISLASASISGLMVLVGVAVLRRDMEGGIHWFRRAVLLNILVTQVFLFYQSQLTAIWGLVIDLLVYWSIDWFLHSGKDGVISHSREDPR